MTKTTPPFDDSQRLCTTFVAIITVCGFQHELQRAAPLNTPSSTSKNRLREIAKHIYDPANRCSFSFRTRKDLFRRINIQLARIYVSHRKLHVSTVFYRNWAKETLMAFLFRKGNFSFIL